MSDIKQTNKKKEAVDCIFEKAASKAYEVAYVSGSGVNCEELNRGADPHGLPGHLYKSVTSRTFSRGWVFFF